MNGVLAPLGEEQIVIDGLLNAGFKHARHKRISRYINVSLQGILRVVSRPVQENVEQVQTTLH